MRIAPVLGTLLVLVTLHSSAVGPSQAQSTEPPPSPSRVELLAGEPGHIGSIDGIGTSARFHEPSGIALSATGQVLVSDSANHTLRLVDLNTTTVSTLAGSANQAGTADGAGTEARFATPTGITLDRTGSVAFVADTANHSVRQVEIDSATVTTYAGLSGTPGSALGTRLETRLREPRGVALVCSPTPLLPDQVVQRSDTVDDCPLLLIADTGNHVLLQLDRATEQVSVLAGQAGSAGALDGTGAAARFNRPAGLAVAPSGRFVLVADLGNNAVRRIDLPSGAVTTLYTEVVSAGQLAQPQPGIFNVFPGCSDDLMLLTNAQTHTVSRIGTLTGAVQLIAGVPNQPGATDGPGLTAQFNQPSGGGVLCTPGQPPKSVIGDSANAVLRIVVLPVPWRTFLPLVMQ